jgi:hypothetical protein
VTRRRPPPLPDPGKPLAEMTAAERAASLRSMLRAIRDDEIRRGSRRPRSMREVEIWRQGEAERAERLAARIARARRRRAARDAKDEAFENMPMAEALETLSDDGSAASRPS